MKRNPLQRGNAIGPESWVKFGYTGAKKPILNVSQCLVAGKPAGRHAAFPGGARNEHTGAEHRIGRPVEERFEECRDQSRSTRSIAIDQNQVIMLRKLNLTNR